MKWTKGKARSRIHLLEKKIESIYEEISAIEASLDPATDMGTSLMKIDNLYHEVRHLEREQVYARLREIPRAELVKKFKWVA